MVFKNPHEPSRLIHGNMAYANTQPICLIKKPVLYRPGDFLSVELTDLKHAMKIELLILSEVNSRCCLIF